VSSKGTALLLPASCEVRGKATIVGRFPRGLAIRTKGIDIDAERSGEPFVLIGIKPGRDAPAVEAACA